MSCIAAMGLGGAWYSQKVFGGIWCREANMKTGYSQKHMGIAYSSVFLLMLVAAFLFALFLGPYPDVPSSVSSGFIVGLGWVGTSFGINYIFANRGWKMILIDTGYHTLQFMLYGLILGLWH